MNSLGKSMKKKILFLAMFGVAFGAPLVEAKEQPTTIKGVSEDSLVLKTHPPHPGYDNFEPVIVHVENTKEATAKLDAFYKRTGKAPNILMYIMDDVGWGDLGCYGGGEMLGAPTPQMDSLAREGVRLTSAYSQPSSSPSRGTILTGRLPLRHGVLLPPMYGQPGGIGGEISIAQLLKENGYATKAIGKWHVGENEESLPHNMGFDSFYGFLSVSDMYTEWRDKNFSPEIALSATRTKMMEELPFERYLVHGPFLGKEETTGQAMPIPDGHYKRLAELNLTNVKSLDADLTTHATEFIHAMKETKDKDGKISQPQKPFFLYFGTRGAHFDNYPHEDFEGKSFSKTPYRDTILELDHHLGVLVQALKDTEQYENTIIFITSDNGPEMETWPDSAYSPFRGAKGTFLEGGVRVPAIFHWKGVLQEGRVEDGLFDFADLFNTFAKLGKVDLPTAIANTVEKRGPEYNTPFIDGIDQTSFLLADNGQSNRKAIYYWDKNKLSAIRCAEFKQHYVAYNDRPYDVVNNGGFSGSTSEGYRFFNLHVDPKEERSILIRKLVYSSVFDELRLSHIASMTGKYKSKIMIKR